MGEVIARFADGRLLVQESAKCAYRYAGSGVPFRIGGIRTVEKVLSLTNDYEKLGITTPLNEVHVGYVLSGKGAYSGQVQELADHIMVPMRRTTAQIDNVTTSGFAAISGSAPFISSVAPLVSGLGYMTELASGNVNISGVITITANVIGYA